MPPTPKKRVITRVATYQTLLTQVRRTLLEGQARIEAERVKTYWQTGQIITKDILKNKDRGEYGAEVTKRLARDLNINIRLIQRCIQFAKMYPQFSKVVAPPLFSWTHYSKLLTIPDAKERFRIEQTAIKNNWSSDELAARIQEEKELQGGLEPTARQDHPKDSTPAPKLLTPLRGKNYHYQIVKRPTLGSSDEPELFLDLGFGMFMDLDPRVSAQFVSGDIIESKTRDEGYKYSKVDATAKDLYTYQAVVEKVIDGDTLKVRFDLGFGLRHRETLRLRDLDCAEMDTKEGQAAKVFVQSYIKEAQVIVVRSSRSDKYDRYLADIFLPQEKEEEIYLNNLLLEKGLAGRI